MATTASPRATELSQNLSEVSRAIKSATASCSRPTQSLPTLVAVSKLKPASDIQHCYEAGHKSFGENYVQECVDKAKQLPSDIQWHFIGPLQSNKAKQLAAIPNLYAFHTLASSKVASLLSKHLAPERQEPLRVFLQINTSSEDSKSGLMPLSADNHDTDGASPLMSLCRHVIKDCPGLRLTGLMTIGSMAGSAADGENHDFTRLEVTRSILEDILSKEHKDDLWGEEVLISGTNEKGRRLLLSMGMSTDFEAAIRQGADVVRVGSSIFGSRPPKGASN